jgi:hypothetical protein
VDGLPTGKLDDGLRTGGNEHALFYREHCCRSKQFAQRRWHLQMLNSRLRRPLYRYVEQ